LGPRSPRLSLQLRLGVESFDAPSKLASLALQMVSLEVMLSSAIVPNRAPLTYLQY
jgi:hypothetical protein